jgi:hypothetical protein
VWDLHLSSASVYLLNKEVVDGRFASLDMSRECAHLFRLFGGQCLFSLPGAGDDSKRLFSLISGTIGQLSRPYLVKTRSSMV